MAASKFSSRDRRIHLYGCGVVAPAAANVKEFLAEVESQECALVLEERLNDMFLVGRPKFDFKDYEQWITQKHNATRFSQLNDKAGECVKFAIGTTIQALECNPGLDAAIQKLDPRVLILCGSGFGDLNHKFQGTREFENAYRNWNYFWAQPERNDDVKQFQEGKLKVDDVPADPRALPVDSPERAEAASVWNEFWARRSSELKKYLKEMNEIEMMTIGGDVAADKLNVIRAKTKARKALMDKYKSPVPPWESVAPTFLWNLPNAPAAQVSMMLGIHGPSSASIGACATFGLLLRQAMDAIESGEYDVAIVQTADVTPPPAVVSAFHAAKVLATGPQVGIPLCQLRGTHVAGGACTWIIGAEDAVGALGLKPYKGVQLLGVGLSSDAEHIITPSLEGPKHCIRDAFKQANISPSEIQTWDMHATGTPGDWSEFKLIEDFVPSEAVITARKGIFGHGMSTCGGWELTAQVLGATKTSGGIRIQPSGIPTQSMHPSIVSLKRRIAADKPLTVETQKETLTCGKLSMGIGGISSCVLTRVHF